MGIALDLKHVLDQGAGTSLLKSYVPKNVALQPGFNDDTVPFAESWQESLSWEESNVQLCAITLGCALIALVATLIATTT